MLVRTPPICLEAKAYSKDASQFAAEVSVAQRQANRQQKSWTLVKMAAAWPSTSSVSAQCWRSDVVCC